MFKLFMWHSPLMRCQWSVLSCKFPTAVSACLSSCPVPEQTAAGLTDHLTSGGQHFSIFKALILNFTESDHVHKTADKIENAVYIWKFMSTLAFFKKNFCFFLSPPSPSKTCKAASQLCITSRGRVTGSLLVWDSETFTLSLFSHILCFSITL